MAFNNPIATQTQAGASAPATVQNTAVQSAISGFADIMSAVSYYNASQQQAAARAAPEAWQVKEEWESSGAQQAVDVAKRYKKWVEIEGRAKAEVRLNAETLNMQSSMGATEGDKFRSTLNSLIGKNSDVNERDVEMERAKAQASKLDELEMAGRSLLMAQGTKYGVDPAKITREQAISVAMVTNGQQQAASLEAAQLGVINARNTQIDRDRKLTSQATAVYQSATITAGIRQSLASFSAAIDQNPNTIEQAKAQFIADMELRKSQVVNELAASVQAAGGNVADIDQTVANGLVSQYNAAIELVRGDYNVQQMKSTLEAMSVGTTIDTIKQLDTPFQRQLLVENTTRMPNSLSNKTVSLTNGMYNPAAYGEVIRNVSSLGAAAAANKTGVPTEKAYGIPYDGLLIATKNPDAKEEAASSLVNTFMNSYQGSSSVRSAANSSKGLPVLMDKIARNPELKSLAPDIQAAAEKEGTTVNQMFMDSTRTMFRESVYPSLSLGDPYVLPNLDIQYKGGKYTVKLKEDEYRKQSKLERNVLPHSGRDLSADKINIINERLATVQTLLNAQVLAYQNLGGNPDDLGEALKYQLEVAAGISRLQTQQ